MKDLRFNRRLFMTWAAGFLLYRNRQGKCLVTDTPEFEKVEDHLTAGGVIYLTDSTGKDFSKLSLNVEKTAYEETLL